MGNRAPWLRCIAPATDRRCTSRPTDRTFSGSRDNIASTSCPFGSCPRRTRTGKSNPSLRLPRTPRRPLVPRCRSRRRCRPSRCPCRPSPIRRCSLPRPPRRRRRSRRCCRSHRRLAQKTRRCLMIHPGGRRCRNRRSPWPTKGRKLAASCSCACPSVLFPSLPILMSGRASLGDAKRRRVGTSSPGHPKSRHHGSTTPSP
jgi:hypothetical protein